MTSRRRVLLAGVLAVLALACRPEREPAPAPAAGPRIVVMAPAAAEMLDRLGFASAVVGVGDFVEWPPAVARKPRLGGYDSPNVERVLALRADLLVTTRSQAGGDVLAQLRGLGVRVLELDTRGYRGVLDSIAALGRALDREPQAQALAAEVRAGVDAVRARAAPLPKRRVLFAVGRDPLYVAGPGSYMDELIAAAGGTNVAADASAPYQLLSMEVALARRPEVIVDTSDNGRGAPRGRLAGPWGQWPFLPAVREGRVYWVDPTRLAIPGPRLPEMALLMARLVHPEVFGEPAAADFGPLPGILPPGGDGR